MKPMNIPCLGTLSCSVCPPSVFARISGLDLQDEEFGGFGGPHCMVRGGYGQITDALAARLDVRLGQPVTSISAEDDLVKVRVKSGTGLAPVLC